MINYRRRNALQPEKESEVQINLMPVLVFVVGYVVARALLGSLKAELK